MIISSALSSIPLISLTDSTRLQMSSKQLGQCVTHVNCRRPYVIGDDWKYLSHSTAMSKKVAGVSGNIVYTNDDIMVVVFDNKPDLKIEVFEIPTVMSTAFSFGSKLRYKRDPGEFEKGDLLFEYDNFIENTPCYGYNVNVAFMPWMGFNYEDAVVISESLSHLCRSLKKETITIPIYSHTLLKSLYKDSKYQFIPEVGQEINKRILSTEYIPRSSNKKQVLQSLNLVDFSLIGDNDFQFNSQHILSKLNNAKISRIKAHRINPNIKALDPNLQTIVDMLCSEYKINNAQIYQDVASLLGKDYAKKLISNHYIMLKPSIKTNDLIAVLEIDLIKDSATEVGDKFANRFANKGVVSLIIPDELRPLDNSGNPIDMILSPLSVFSRMNLGQLLEGLIGKAIRKAEEQIKNGDVFAPLENIAKLSDAIGTTKYSIEIRELLETVKTNQQLLDKFIRSVEIGGLYFEVPGFTNFDTKEIYDTVKELFDVTPNDNITASKELLTYMRTKLQLENDIALPTKDVIYKDIFNAPIYTLKLMQLSESKLNARDWGEYSASSKTPTIKGKSSIGKASRIGNMEFDALLGHDAIQAVKEIRTVKSDALHLKSDLVNQMLNTGTYNLPNDKSKSYTKTIIDSLMVFINEN
jgi:DNA-directed RNA polymerase beta subunit